LPGECGVDHPDVESLFPADVVKRAKQVRDILGGAGTGAYTGSQGALGFRKDVAKFISKRDGHPAYPGNIFLTNGASSAIEMILTTIVSNELDGIMIPIPQYPIYSALIAKLTGRQIGYELEEEKNWAASREELEMRLHSAQADGITVKALAIINPGNPTGQVFSREDLEVICTFCAENGIVLLADEVYQRNVYAPNKDFLSAKKVALETAGCENLQLISFHSTSKGVIGECGRRGGYMELHNIDSYVQSQLYKLASSGLCSNVPGQIMTSLMVNPPQPGDESYEQFVKEESDIFEGLKRRSKALVDGLNAVDGITCNNAEGAMYAFPNVTLPPKAIEYAGKHDMTPDTLYALSLLDETGICVVPASGFGQKEGRYGFRTTFLPPDEQMLPAIELFASHHRNFCKKFE
jgi:aspartate/methionine/tyrosine aminotransferase